MAVKYLTDENPDGWSLGQSSSSKISFYGATPIVKATVTSTVTATATTTALEATLDLIGTALHNLGLITYAT